MKAIFMRFGIRAFRTDCSNASTPIRRHPDHFLSARLNAASDP
jgi:hypothetical protein